MLSSLMSAFEYDGTMSLEIVIWSLFMGVVIAALITYIKCTVLGVLVRRLLKADGVSAENAKSVKELELEKNALVKLALRSKRPYSGAVKAVLPDGSEIGSLKTLPDGIKRDELRYYIPEDKAFRAELTYKRKGNDLITVIVAVVLFLAIALLAFTVIPYLVSMATSVF